MDDFYKSIAFGVVSTTFLLVSTVVGCRKAKTPKKPEAKNKLGNRWRMKEPKKVQLSAVESSKRPSEIVSSADQGSSIRLSSKENAHPKNDKKEKKEERACLSDSPFETKKKEYSMRMDRTQPSEKEKKSVRSSRRSSKKMSSEMNSAEPMMSARPMVNMDETQQSASIRCFDNDDTDEFFNDLKSDRVKSSARQ